MKLATVTAEVVYFLHNNLTTHQWCPWLWSLGDTASHTFSTANVARNAANPHCIPRKKVSLALYPSVLKDGWKRQASFLSK
jgi:hypothetical protein